MKSKLLIEKYLFISRQLEADSVFFQLEAKGWKIIDQSLLNIEFIQVESIPESDWIFFYSPNGVKAFAQNAERLNFNIHSVKIGAYGPGTADAINAVGWHLDFIGTGQAAETRYKFNTMAAATTVLFPLPSKSKHTLLSSGIYTFTPLDLVVYNNSMNPREILPCKVYIFTSSMNVKSFFQCNNIAAGAQVLAIGQPTTDSLREYYSGEIQIPLSPTEQGLFQLI